jgi:hypothetical protein
MLGAKHWRLKNVRRVSVGRLIVVGIAMHCSNWRGNPVLRCPGFVSDKRMMVNQFIDSSLSVLSAKTTIAADCEVILNEVIAQFGSYSKADDYVSKLMEDGLSHPWFGKYSRDTDATSRRAI